MEDSASANQLLWEEQQRGIAAHNSRVNRVVLRNFVLVMSAIALTVAAVVLAGAPALRMRE